MLTKEKVRRFAQKSRMWKPAKRTIMNIIHVQDILLNARVLDAIIEHELRVF